MGSKSFRLTLLYFLVIFEFSATVQKSNDLCKTKGCKCTEINNWENITCNIDSDEDFQLSSGQIPENTVHIEFVGGKEITINPGTFDNSLGGLLKLFFNGTSVVKVDASAFKNLSSNIFRLQVYGCDVLKFNNEAFSKCLKPVKIHVENCKNVEIGRRAFSRLSKAEFKSVQNLRLKEEAFGFEKVLVDNEILITEIIFDDVTIDVVPKRTFPSSCQKISIVNSKITEIQQRAFDAMQIEELNFEKTRIGKIQRTSFRESLLVKLFRISQCDIEEIESNALLCSMSNLNINFSKITVCKSSFVNSSKLQNFSMYNTTIDYLETNSLTLHSNDRTDLQNNHFKYLYRHFLSITNFSNVDFIFEKNEIDFLENGSFHFFPSRYSNKRLNNNYFNRPCFCDMELWLSLLLDSNSTILVTLYNTSFCRLSNETSDCLKSHNVTDINDGMIPIPRFSTLLCGTSREITCEPLLNTKTFNLNATNDEEKDGGKTSNIILIAVLCALLIIAISGTFVILLIRGGLWLKRKGYCVRFRVSESRHHNSNDIHSIYDEGTVVETDLSERSDVPDELTPQILQSLRERLEDPTTHDEAREMIEKLYDHFIVNDDTYKNNNTHQEAHLYEELGNLQIGKNQTEKESKEPAENVEPFGILRLMEERYKLIPSIGESKNNTPTLAVEYAEPTDLAVHLYSELNQNKDLYDNGGNSNNFSTFKPADCSSARVQFKVLRPLPKEPPQVNEYQIPGPSNF